jgi:hypothetical protein
MNELAPKLKNVEKLAAQFSADPEELLPEAGALETARSYREKKAKPLLAGIVKVLRILICCKGLSICKRNIIMKCRR